MKNRSSKPASSANTLARTNIAEPVPNRTSFATSCSAAGTSASGAPACRL
jgi:hypothetical protein